MAASRGRGTPLGDAPLPTTLVKRANRRVAVLHPLVFLQAVEREVLARAAARVARVRLVDALPRAPVIHGPAALPAVLRHLVADQGVTRREALPAGDKLAEKRAARAVEGMRRRRRDLRSEKHIVSAA